jgi:hypothetical protein
MIISEAASPNTATNINCTYGLSNTYVRHNGTHLLNVNKALIVNGHAAIWNFDNNEFNPNEWPLYVYHV